jgi:L-lysine 6-transaminase
MLFIEGGALAVENTLKAAMDWKVRKNIAAGRGERGTEILHFRHAFHGRSGYAMSLTNTDRRKTDLFAKFIWPRVSTPFIDFSLPEAEREKDVIAKEKKSEAEIMKLVRTKGNDIAAIIIEPIQGEGGDNHFRPEFYRAVRQLADENEMLLIFDEVQSGVGLTGKMWSWQHFGVEPDLFAFGKKTQVCGFVSNDRIFDIDDNVVIIPSRINSTWGGNLTDMVRSQRYFEVIDEEKLVDNAAKVGAYFVSELQRFQEEFPKLVTNVRGRGLMAAFDLPSGEIRDNALKAFMTVDVMVLSSGTRSARFRPPLNFTMEEAAEGIKRMEKALKELA